MNDNNKKNKLIPSIKRLFKELRVYKVLIIISLFLAITSSILIINTPDVLKKITDEIGKGLIVDRKVVDDLNNKIKDNIKNINYKDIFNINKSNVERVFSNNDISFEDKNKFKELISVGLDKNLNNIPTSVLNIIIDDSTYNNIYISKEDKINFIMSNYKVIPLSIMSTMDNIKINNINITGLDQGKYILLMDGVNKNNYYERLDKAPKSINKLLVPVIKLNMIERYALILLIIYIISSLMMLFQSLIMANVSNDFGKVLRKNISKKINKLPLKYFDNSSKGDILSRLTNDVDQIVGSFNQSFGVLIEALTMFFGILIMMFITNWIMAITSIVSSLIGFVLMGLIMVKSQTYFKNRQKKIGELNGYIEEIFSGLLVVKSYNAKGKTTNDFDKLNNGLYGINLKSQFFSSMMMPVMTFVGLLSHVLVFIIGAILVFNNKISFGVIVAFIFYSRFLTSRLGQIAQGATQLQIISAASDRVFEFLDEKEMEKETVKNELLVDSVKGNIEFKKVNFSYDGIKKVIKNFSCDIKPGWKVAIVGPTGSGKTTLVNLLMRFYDIKQGDILIDGVSIKDISKENLHNLFTMVLQDTWVFEDTIKENIIYNKKGVSLEEVKKVSQSIGFDHFVKTLPDGYDSVISNNSSLSAGQIQLLTIARGIIDDAPILILDEATSNVDSRTEELVQKAMDKLIKGKTSFIIAHRLSTIKNSDLILVMKDGNIIEKGTHNELLNKKGFYFEMYNSQFKLK